MSDDVQDWRAVLDGRREWAVVLGDCLDVLRELPAGSVDAVVTDPPYGLGRRLNGGSWGNVSAWDTVCDIAPVLDVAPVVVVWGGNYYPLPLTRGWLSWYKPDAPPSMASFELAWTNLDANARQISHSIAATNGERCGHPTQKPVRVMAWCLDRAKVAEGAVVFDPYAGSGTTGVACLQTGRRFIGVEIDPTYHAIAVERLTKAAYARQPALPLAVSE